MRIKNLEIPEEYDGRTVFVMVGIELFAYKELGKPWMIKTGRCSQCGRCCKRLKDGFIFPTEDGRCTHLVKRPAENKYLCGLGSYRPIGCSTGRARNIPECTEKFEPCE